MTLRNISTLNVVRGMAATFLVAGLMVSAAAQDGSSQPKGVPDDWSHHHVIFSDPGTMQDALENGTYDHWYLITSNPRFQMQKAKRQAVQLPQSDEVQQMAGPQEQLRGGPPRRSRGRMNRDWSVALGGGGVAATMYPAKYTFDIGGPPSCTDYAVFPANVAGAAGTKAHQTGTFSASSGTGTVVVDGVTLTASPGTAASQSTTINTNGATSGSTITITNGASHLTLTASTPVAEVDNLAFSAKPASTSSVTIAGIVYEFLTSGWGTGPPSGTCYVARATGTGITLQNTLTFLGDAITDTGTQSTTTWQCNNASQPTNGVNLTSSTSPNVVVTAKIVGSTGFTTSLSGTTNITITTPTLGSDGSSTSPSFQWWFGAAAASPAQLATNIITAITTGTAVGVAATSGGSGVVNLTASLTGLAGNSISVATTIPSGLTGGKFNGNLAGGTAGTTSGTTFSTSTDSATQSVNLANEATALASAINTNVPAVTAGSAAAVVTVTDGAAGLAGNSIGVTGTVNGTFAWTSTTLLGGANGQGNLVGITELYSGTSPTGYCGTAPTVLFSYYVGTGTAATSPSLSEDGTKVAYVESVTGASKFHVLKLGTSGNNGVSGVGPAVPGTANNAADTAITMNGGVQVTLSSPYIDYGNDIAYVGDDSGRLHKFTPVFNGTPAEVVTSGVWPATVSSGNVLTGPTLDSSTGRIFVGDSVGVLRYVTASTGAVGGTTVNVGNLNGTGTNSGRALIDPPVVDSSVGMVYAFIGCALPTGGSCGGGTGFGAVMQATTALASPKWIALGTGSGTNNMHIGAFDNTYYTGPIASGHLYVCGNPSLADNPTLYQISFLASGVMNVASGTTRNLATNSGSDNATECSPLAELYNTTTSTDWLFLSVANFCNATGGGTAGCVQNFNITSGFPPAGIGAAESIGTSAIIIDNVSSAGQASSIYFGTLPGGANNAIKLTQSGLN